MRALESSLSHFFIAPLKSRCNLIQHRAQLGEQRRCGLSRGAWGVCRDQDQHHQARCSADQDINQPTYRGLAVEAVRGLDSGNEDGGDAGISVTTAGEAPSAAVALMASKATTAT